MDKNHDILIEKQYYIKNWNDYWQSYAYLNPDLGTNGITTKRALMNHYITCGYKENRKVKMDELYTSNKDTSNKDTSNKNTSIEKQFLLTENMFIEKFY